MPDWSDGYITNIDYTSGFYPGLSPHAQNFSLLYRGFAPPDISEGFTYCELGCGHGFSTALLAAANPQGAFWGIDFNPAHIASAEGLKRAAGVENVTFLDQSFVEALKGDLPQFDFIALHGVWSWVSSDNRRAILDFFHARLKPGGVVYISYNALPGWAAAAPLRQLLVERLRGQGDPTAASIDDAISFATRMREARAGYFVANEQIGRQLDAMTAMSRNYLAHEYFNRAWSASYHSEVAAELEAAKLAFAAASVLTEQMDPLILPQQAHEILKDIANPTARETIRDYFLNTQFRRDLFVRGARRLSDAERHERLLQTRLVLIRQRPEFPFKVKVPIGEVTIEANPAKAVFDALAEGPRTLGDILRDPQVEAAGGGNLAFQGIAILLAGGAIMPALGPEHEAIRRKTTARFNRAMLGELETERHEQTLAASVLGTGMVVPRIDQIFLAHAAGNRAPPIETLVEQLSVRDLAIVRGGQPGSADGTKDELKRKMAEFRRDRLPIYRQIGIV
jgi:SAM-dependent methyltransferase